MKPAVDFRAAPTSGSLETVQILKSWMCLLFVSSGS